MLGDDKVGIQQYRALSILCDSESGTLPLREWRQGINRTTYYGQGSGIAASLLKRGMVEWRCVCATDTHTGDCLIAITPRGEGARLARAMTGRLLARA